MSHGLLVACCVGSLMCLTALVVRADAGDGLFPCRLNWLVECQTMDIGEWARRGGVAFVDVLPVFSASQALGRRPISTGAVFVDQKSNCGVVASAPGDCDRHREARAVAAGLGGQWRTESAVLEIWYIWMPGVDRHCGW